MRALVCVVLVLGCHRDEPVADGKPLSHWASEARQVSWFSFWNSSKDERRRTAFRHLTEIGEPAVPTLIELLNSDSPSVSGDAVNALAALGPRAAAAVPDLMEMLSRREPAQRVRAIVILGAIGPQASVAVAPLTQALRDPDANVVRVAAASLAKMGAPGQAALDRGARSRDAVMRQGAMTGLADVPRTPAETREYVTSALSDIDPLVRARGIELLLANRGAAMDESSDLLVRAMNDSIGAVSDAARRVFQIAVQNGGPPRLLAAVMTDGDVASRADAAWRLGHKLSERVPSRRISAESTSEIRLALEKALKDPDSKVRVYAARAMAAGYPGTHARIASVLRREIPKADVDIAVRGAGVLWQLTHRLEDVEPVFTAGLASTDRWVRMETLSELIKLGRAAQPLVPAIERLLEDPVPDVRERAERTLAFLAQVQARP